MDSLIKVDDQWVPLQVKVFSRWVSTQLQGQSDTKVEDITKDLSNGVALCNLATILTKKDAPRAWACDPKRNVDMVQNCELAVDMFEKDGVKLIGISGKDINDNNMKLILGLVWSLILHYQIGQSVAPEISNGKDNTNESVDNNNASKDTAKNQKEALLSWASERTANYPNIHNFQPFDLSLCALLDTYVPEKINYYSLDPNDSHHNSELATNVMHELGIPVFVYPDELERHDNKVDEKILLTQLSTAKVVLDKRPPPEVKAEATTVEKDDNEVESVSKDVDVHDDDDDDDAVVVGENPEWVIEEDEVPLGKQSSSTVDSLIDLSVVPVDPNTKNGVSILASSAEWITNEGIENQVIGKTVSSGENLIDLSAVSDDQSNENVEDADSKLIGDNADDHHEWVVNPDDADNVPQEKDVSLNEEDANTDEQANESEEDESSGNYDDAVLIWTNPNIDYGDVSDPSWVIDDIGDVEIVPDHLGWEFDGDAPDGLAVTDDAVPNWVVDDDFVAPAGDEEVFEWVVGENGPEEVVVEEGTNVEPEWVIVKTGLTHRSVTSPSIQRWEINDAQAEALKAKSAEETIEQQLLAREMSYHDVNEHGTPEDNDESADYTVHHMFITKKSWF